MRTKFNISVLKHGENNEKIVRAIANHNSGEAKTHSDITKELAILPVNETSDAICNTTTASI